MKKIQKKWNIGARVVLSLGGLIVVVVLIVALATGTGGFSVEGIVRSFTYRNLGSSQLAGEYDLDEHRVAAYTALGDGLLIASKNGYEYIGKDGETYQSEVYAMAQPAIHTAGDAAVVYDIGGSSACVLGESGLLYTIENDKTVISAKVNQSGWSAVCTTETGTKGAVTVYNSGGTAVYQRRLSEGYLVTAAVSPDGKGIYILSLAKDGSRIQRFDLANEEIQAEYNDAGMVYNDIGYTSDTNLAAVSNEQLLFLDQSCRNLGTYTYTSGTLSRYVLGEYSLVYTGKYQGAEAGTLVRLNGNGEVFGKLECDGKIIGLSQAGKYTAVLIDGQLAVYDNALTKYAETEVTGNVQRALVRDDGTVLLISDYHVKLFVP